MHRENSEVKYSLDGIEQRITKSFGGYYIALPLDYEKTNKTYPLLFFLHGQGQMGNGNEHLQYLLHDGIGKWIKDEMLPSSFRFNQKKSSFIIAMPQYSQQPSAEEVLECVDYFTKAYRADPQRIYLSGLSLGARLITLAAASRPYAFAAMVPIAGVATSAGMEERCMQIGQSKLPVWELHNEKDPLADVEEAKKFISLLQQADPGGKSKITVFNVYGHDAWTSALNPEFKEDSLNIYEWMLQFSR